MAALRQTLKSTSWLAWLLPLISSLAGLAAIWFWAQNSGWLQSRGEWGIETSLVIIAIGYPTLGAFILQRQPGNRIAWLFCLIGLGAGLQVFSSQYAIYAFFTIQKALPLAGFLSWVQNWAWFMPFTLTIVLILLYPNGQALSPRWKILVWVIVATVVLMIFATLLLWDFRGPIMYVEDNRVAPPELARREGLLRAVGIPVIIFWFFVGLPLSVLSLFIRLSRAGHVERQQIKWFLFSGLMFTLILVTGMLFLIFPINEWLGNLFYNIVLGIAAIAMLLAVSAAILRYRLYDIDLIIRRTIIYAVLTVILAVLYYGSVLVTQGLLRSITGEETQVGLVISTLLIAALFTPLRLALQQSIDRRFYRDRYNIETTLNRFTTTMRNEVDLESLSNQLMIVVDDSIRPESLSLWMRK